MTWEATMKRWLYHYDIVHGSPERLERVLRHRVRDLLAAVTADDHAETTPQGELLVRLPAPVLGLQMHKTVRVHTGVAEQHGSRTCIPLRWQADPAKLAFPAFEGTIEFEPQSRSTAHLTIVGAANLPFGVVGAAADATFFGEVADRTIRHLAAQLTAALERAASEPQPSEPEPVASPNQLRVRDVMSPNPLVLHDDMPVKTAALLLFHYGVAGAPVRNDVGGLVGVLSEADLLDTEAPLRYGLSRAAEASRRRKLARTVGDACTRPAIEVTPSATVPHAAELMRDHSVARLIVVDDSDIVGVVSRHDVLKALVRNDVETRAVLDRLLADEGESHMLATVDWGIAHLTGRVSARSRVDSIVDQVDSLDGIVGVESDLTWEVDDVIPPVVPTL
jgi:CBS domain-containing protein